MRCSPTMTLLESMPGESARSYSVTCTPGTCFSAHAAAKPLIPEPTMPTFIFFAKEIRPRAAESQQLGFIRPCYAVGRTP